MGTSCNLNWGDGCKEVVWVTDPTHPVAHGIPKHFILEEEELYGEQFDIPAPDSLVFTSWFASGHVFRSGCAYKRGLDVFSTSSRGMKRTRPTKTKQYRRLS